MKWICYYFIYWEFVVFKTPLYTTARPCGFYFLFSQVKARQFSSGKNQIRCFSICRIKSILVMACLIKLMCMLFVKYLGASLLFLLKFLIHVSGIGSAIPEIKQVMV